MSKKILLPSYTYTCTHTNTHGVRKRGSLILFIFSKRMSLMTFQTYLLYFCSWNIPYIHKGNRKNNYPWHFFKNVIQKICDYWLFSVDICCPVGSNTPQSVWLRKKNMERIRSEQLCMTKQICKIRTKNSSSSICSLVSLHLPFV